MGNSLGLTTTWPNDKDPITPFVEYYKTHKEEFSLSTQEVVDTIFLGKPPGEKYTHSEHFTLKSNTLYAGATGGWFADDYNDILSHMSKLSPDITFELSVYDSGMFGCEDLYFIKNDDVIENGQIFSSYIPDGPDKGVLCEERHCSPDQWDKRWFGDDRVEWKYVGYWHEKQTDDDKFERNEITKEQYDKLWGRNRDVIC